MNIIYFIIDGDTSHFSRLKGEKYLKDLVILKGLTNLKQWHLDKRWFRAFLLVWQQYIAFRHQLVIALSKRTKKELTLYWLDVMGFGGAIVAKILKDERPILILNIMLSDSSSILSRLKKRCFHHIIRWPNVYCTINAPYLAKYYRVSDEFEHKCFPLGDVIHFDEEITQIGSVDDCGYILCIGSAGRDIDLFFSIVRAQPHEKFVWITKSDHHSYGTLPSNLKIEISPSFQKVSIMIYNSKLVILPLSTQSPAGILSIVHTVNIGRPILVTKTVSSVQYFMPGSHCIVEGRVLQNWEKKINSILRTSNSELEKEYSFTKNKTSVVNYWNRLNEIIHEIQSSCYQ